MQFYLAINMDAVDGDVPPAAYLSKGAAMSHVDVADVATHIFLCTVDENRMRDVTEDLALDWWEATGYELQTIPHAYERFLKDHIAQREIEAARAEDSREARALVRMREREL